MKRLSIIGAGGHGRVIADIAKLEGYTDIIFFDDDRSLSRCGEYNVMGMASEAWEIESDVIIGIGNHMARRYFCQMYSDRLVTLVHPDAVIADDVEIGTGTVVMAGAVINPGSKIGAGCIVNTSCSVDHDCRIGDYVHIAVGARLSGTVVVGDGTWLGVGAVVSNNVTICGRCTIGAGAVVIRDISEPGTYIGVPARITKNGQTMWTEKE